MVLTEKLFNSGLDGQRKSGWLEAALPRSARRITDNGSFVFDILTLLSVNPNLLFSCTEIACTQICIAKIEIARHIFVVAIVSFWPETVFVAKSRISREPCSSPMAVRRCC